MKLKEKVRLKKYWDEKMVARRRLRKETEYSKKYRGFRKAGYDPELSRFFARLRVEYGG